MAHTKRCIENQWICPSDHLPPPERNVLVLTEGGRYFVAYYLPVQYTQRVIWRDATSHADIEKFILKWQDRVIGWQELPETVTLLQLALEAKA
jgi:hypothetical protein